MFIHNPTDELVKHLINLGDVVSVEFDERSVELTERCNLCHQLIPNNSYCFCDWLREPETTGELVDAAYGTLDLWTIGNTLHSYPNEWNDEAPDRLAGNNTQGE